MHIFCYDKVDKFDVSTVDEKVMVVKNPGISAGAGATGDATSTAVKPTKRSPTHLYTSTDNENLNAAEWTAFATARYVYNTPKTLQIRKANTISSLVVT